MEKLPRNLARTVALAIGAAFVASSAFAQPVDTARIQAGDANDWLTYHGSYNSYHYSPLDQINTNNVSNLGVAWIHIPGRSTRGLQSMPLVADGVLYYTGSYSRTFALNGATGEVIWSYIPELDEALISRQTHSPYNRGAAIGDGKVYVGTMDGRLIALDMKTGKPVWDTKLVDSQKLTVGFTGAPLLRQGHRRHRLAGRGMAGTRADLRRRRGDRGEEMGVQHGRGHRRRHEDMGQRFLAHRRWRRLDAGHLRHRDQHDLVGHRQPGAALRLVGSRFQDAGRAPRRQSLHLLGDRARCRYRQAEILSIRSCRTIPGTSTARSANS